MFNSESLGCCGLEPAALAAVRAFLAEPANLRAARAFGARHLATAKPASPAPTESRGVEYDGLLQLSAVLLALPEAERRYRELNRPRQLLGDTLADVGVWVRHFQRNYGGYGLAWIATGWLARHLHGDVVRLGRLQCNTAYLYRGRPVINLHIPEDGPLEIAACRDSFRRMAEFFAAYRPDFAYEGAVCTSWLLDPQLRQLLKPDANILRFQEFGERFEADEPSDAVFRVFGVKAAEQGLDAVEPATSLQRAMADFIRRGGAFKMYTMRIPRDRFLELGQPSQSYGVLFS